MAFLKWLFVAILKVPLLLSVPIASIIVPLFYRYDLEGDKDMYERGFFGDLYIPFDNPVQGDRAWISKHSYFPEVVVGFKGYLNRVGWLLRNPIYGFSKWAKVTYDVGDELIISGNPDISDKYKISGWMFATLRDSRGKLKAFEWYSVTPYTERRNVRIRLGWKIKTDKMQERGWARHVATINPFDGYGSN